MKNLLFLLLFPSLVFAQDSAPPESTPMFFFVEVLADKVIVHPGQTEIPAGAIADPGGPFTRWVDQIAANQPRTPVALVFRPDSLALQRPLSRILEKREVPFFKEPWEADRPLDPEILRRSIASAAASLPPPQGQLEKLQVHSTTVLIPTPIEIPPAKEPVYWECRQGQLFAISLANLQAACNAKTQELQTQAAGAEEAFLRQAAQTTLDVDGQRVDYSYALIGRFVFTPLPGAQGCALESNPPDSCFSTRLTTLDPEQQSLRFFVRPDSLEIFRKARTLAWARGLEVAVELIAEKEPITLGSAAGARIQCHDSWIKR